MKSFVAGAKGMLASDLIPLLKKMGAVVEGDLPNFDITDREGIERLFGEVQPDVVINCAAYTAVDKAESEQELAFEINARGAGNIAKACSKINVPVVHISTDFVFDGEINLPYREDDETGPLSVYGASKLDGERRVREAAAEHIIIRTSWLYGQQGNHFVNTMARLASEREDMGVIFDQIGTPTYTVDLARAIITLIEKEARGTFHFSNEGVASWYDFAYEIFQVMRNKGVPIKLKTLRPITTEDFPTPAARPKYSVMNKEKYKETTGAAIPHWKNGLLRYFEEQ